MKLLDPVGMNAPGLGTVVDAKRMQESYSPTVRYSGKPGWLVLIVLTSKFHGDAKYAIAPWYDHQDETEDVIGAAETLDTIYEYWKKLQTEMEV